MSIIRPGQPNDLESLYAISLLTGHEGGDATSLYQDPDMIGHIYSAPYLLHAPETCFVAEDDQGLLGYVVGVTDTRGFAALLEQHWWPKLRQQYNDPVAATSPDQQRARMIHHPAFPPQAVLDAFPAHLHMNLLPRGQRQGLGTKLLQIWAASVAKTGDVFAHVGVNAANKGGYRFWRAAGFDPIPEITDGIWLGQRFAQHIS